MNRSLVSSRHYLLQNVFPAWLGFATVFGGIVFFAIPRVREASAVAHVAYRLDYAWTVMYLLGGLSTLYGILRVQLRYEVVGKVLLATAFTLSGLSLIYYRGWVGAPTAVVTLSLAAACLTRAYVLVQTRHSIVVGSGDGG